MTGELRDEPRKRLLRKVSLLSARHAILPHCLTSAGFGSFSIAWCIHSLSTWRSCLKQVLFGLLTKSFFPWDDRKKKCVWVFFLNQWVDLLFHSLTGKPSFLSNLRNPGRMVPHLKPGETVPMIDTWSLFLFPPGNPYVYWWQKSVVVMVLFFVIKKAWFFFVIKKACL